MSVKIVQKPLPHGNVPYADMTDPSVKKRVMLLNENIVSLAAQLSELQRAAIELQQRPMPKQKEIEDIERYVAQAAASAESAAGSATSAGASATSAGTAATSASGSATSAGTSATNAGTSATAANEAKLASESARDEAVPAAQTATTKAQEASASADRAEAAARTAEWSLTFVLCHNIGLTPSNGTFPHVVDLSYLVPDSSKTYDVTATFFCTYTGTQTTLRYFKVGSGERTSAPFAKGVVAVATCVAEGTDVIGVINGAASTSGTSGYSYYDTMLTIREHHTT